MLHSTGLPPYPSPRSTYITGTPCTYSTITHCTYVQYQHTLYLNYWHTLYIQYQHTPFFPIAGVKKVKNVSISYEKKPSESFNGMAVGLGLKHAFFSPFLHIEHERCVLPSRTDWNSYDF